MPKYEKENLVALTLHGGHMKVETLEEAKVLDPHFSVYSQAGNWHRYYNFMLCTRKIGESFDMPQGHRWGIIGVYDTTEIDHVNSMVFAAIRNSQNTIYGEG